MSRGFQKVFIFCPGLYGWGLHYPAFCVIMEAVRWQALTASTLVLDSRLLVQGWAAIFFYCLGIAARMIRAASAASFAVASTSFARVSRYDANSVWVMLSSSTFCYLLPGSFGIGFLPLPWFNYIPPYIKSQEKAFENACTKRTIIYHQIYAK